MTIEHQCGCKVNIFEDSYSNVFCDHHKSRLNMWMKHFKIGWTEKADPKLIKYRGVNKK